MIDEVILVKQLDEALSLAADIDEALAEAWGFDAQPWEHLGDAQRDVSVLIAGLRAADQLMAGMVPIEQA